jgi:hypothetical protein
LIARSLLGLASALALLGCFLQKVDSGAASGGTPAADDAGTDAAPMNDDAAPPVAIVDGTPIATDDGGTTGDPCVPTVEQARAIRQTYCAGCHAPPAKMGGFDFVMDDAKLLTAVSATVDDAGAPLPFLVPGDPDRSRIYHRAAVGEMPPVQAPPLPPNPAPTVSDLSVLRAWITTCCKKK